MLVFKPVTLLTANPDAMPDNEKEEYKLSDPILLAKKLLPLSVAGALPVAALKPFTKLLPEADVDWQTAFASAADLL